MEDKRLSLQEVTAIARETVREAEHEVIAAIPAEGDAGYVEIVLQSRAAPHRLTVGVHRMQPADRIRATIAARMRDPT